MRTMEDQDNFVASLVGMEVEAAKEAIAKSPNPINPLTGFTSPEPWLIRIRSVITNGKETVRPVITMDARGDRINLWIEDGIVTRAWIG